MLQCGFICAISKWHKWNNSCNIFWRNESSLAKLSPTRFLDSHHISLYIPRPAAASSSSLTLYCKYLEVSHGLMWFPYGQIRGNTLISEMHDCGFSFLYLIVVVLPSVPWPVTNSTWIWTTEAAGVNKTSWLTVKAHRYVRSSALCSGRGPPACWTRTPAQCEPR